MIGSNSDWNNARSTCFGSLFGRIAFARLSAEFIPKLEKLSRENRSSVIEKNNRYMHFRID